MLEKERALKELPAVKPRSQDEMPIEQGTGTAEER
jgi:hypothetical protein